MVLLLYDIKQENKNGYEKELRGKQNVFALCKKRW